MSNYSKLPPNQKAKVDAYITDLANKIRAELKNKTIGQRQELEADVQRWKDEADRWRQIQMREYFSQDSE
jgi:hypothetical protein